MTSVTGNAFYCSPFEQYKTNVVVLANHISIQRGHTRVVLQTSEEKQNQ